MAQYITTNVTSLVAQNNLSRSSSDLATNLERLSSGQRINSASDDAAGMAIASRMTAQVKGMEMAKRNTQDAISMTQTAEGAMGVQVGQLQRIRELAVQASNGMLNNADLEKINNEAQSLIQELDKVAVGTNYNGNPLLDNNGTVTFQVGANNGDTRVVGLVDTRIAELGKAGGQITVSNGANLFDINTDANFTNVDGGATLAHKAGIDMSASISFTSTATTPLPAPFDGSEELTGGDFSAFDVGDVSTITVTDPATGATTDLEITVTNNSGTVGEFTVKHLSSPGSGVPLNAISMTTQGGAQSALISIDSALTTIQTARSNMGAYQNRFEQVTENLNTSIQNTSAARGRIQDADFAKETAEMTKNQILSQAGVSMLSQANQLPQNVLSLLK